MFDLKPIAQFKHRGSRDRCNSTGVTASTAGRQGWMKPTPHGGFNLPNIVGFIQAGKITYLNNYWLKMSTTMKQLFELKKKNLLSRKRPASSSHMQLLRGDRLTNGKQPTEFTPPGRLVNRGRHVKIPKPDKMKCFQTL